MVTDSSSGTLPSSSRLTIVSSSSIARSKLSFLTSTWVFSAMSLLFRMRPCRRRFEDIYTRILWRDSLRRDLLPEDVLPEDFTRPSARWHGPRLILSGPADHSRPRAPRQFGRRRWH